MLPRKFWNFENVFEAFLAVIFGASQSTDLLSVCLTSVVE